MRALAARRRGVQSSVRASCRRGPRAKRGSFTRCALFQVATAEIGHALDRVVLKVPKLCDAMETALVEVGLDRARRRWLRNVIRRGIYANLRQVAEHVGTMDDVRVQIVAAAV